MPGLKCENALEYGRSLDEAMPVDKWLAKLRETVGSNEHSAIKRQVIVPDYPAYVEPPKESIIDDEFDHMQSVVTCAVASGRLTGMEALELGRQIERARGKRKGQAVAAMLAKDGADPKARRTKTLNRYNWR